MARGLCFGCNNAQVLAQKCIEQCGFTRIGFPYNSNES